MDSKVTWVGGELLQKKWGPRQAQPGWCRSWPPPGVCVEVRGVHLGRAALSSPGGGQEQPDHERRAGRATQARTEEWKQAKQTLPGTGAGLLHKHHWGGRRVRTEEPKETTGHRPQPDRSQPTLGLGPTGAPAPRRAVHAGLTSGWRAVHAGLRLHCPRRAVLAGLTAGQKAVHTGLIPG